MGSLLGFSFPFTYLKYSFAIKYTFTILQAFVIMPIVIYINFR